MVTQAKRAKDFLADPSVWQPEIRKLPSFYEGSDETCFERTLALSCFQVCVMLDPMDVITVLRKAKIDFLALGLYGISGWLKEPRATEDFDVLVPKRQVKRAVSALHGAFPNLQTKDTPVVVRFFQGTLPVLDVMKPHHPLFQAALKNTTAGKVGRFKVNVPDLETALALKFFAMTSVGRQQKDKFQDAHDFLNIIQNNKAFDLGKLSALGELAFAGGGTEIVKMLRDARAGRKLKI